MKFIVTNDKNIEKYGFDFIKEIKSDVGRRKGMYLFKNNGKLDELKSNKIQFSLTNRYFL